jgi:serine/threonine protein kinase
LADFGLSKKISEASSKNSIFGVFTYVDPKSFEKNDHYKLDKKSDIYSIGVLMWQISSGYRPFHNENYDIILMLKIQKGKREKVIDGTPKEYSDLYKSKLSFILTLFF